MPVTQPEYEARERFLLELLGLSQEAAAVMQAMGIQAGSGFGRPTGDPNSPEFSIRAVARTFSGVYDALNGSAVQPGSLYPPTQSMLEQVAAARAELEGLRRSARK